MPFIRNKKYIICIHIYFINNNNKKLLINNLIIILSTRKLITFEP